MNSGNFNKFDLLDIIDKYIGSHTEGINYV